MTKFLEHHPGLYRVKISNDSVMATCYVIADNYSDAEECINQFYDMSQFDIDSIKFVPGMIYIKVDGEQ